MFTERPLFEPALAGINLTAFYRYPEGWVVHFAVRKEGDLDWRAEGHYDRLSTDEALDVLCAHLEQLRQTRRREV